MKVDYRLCMVLIIILNSNKFTNSFFVSNIKWTKEVELTPGFDLRWNSEDADFLTMEMSGSTTGYLGIGFSPDGTMLNSDIVIAWVDHKGLPHIKDYHGIGKLDPVEDTQQDYFLIAASEKDNRTTVRFHRRWETCDEQNDVTIGNETIRLIWAWHQDDPSLSEDPARSGSRFPWHGVSGRGATYTNIRLPSQSIPFPDEPDMRMITSEDNVLVWDATVLDVDIEGRMKHHCASRILNIPRLRNSAVDMVYAIGYRPTITEDNVEYVHKIVLFRCDLTEGERKYTLSTENWSLNQEQTSTCHSSNNLFLTNRCQEVVISWAFGSEGEMFPTHVAIPMSIGDNAFYKLDVHYDNPRGKLMLDSSGIRVFYTVKPRLFNAGALRVAHKVSPFMALPPSQEGFKIYGICLSSCTKNEIPEDGINVFGVSVHAHKAGRKVRVRHLREGKELHAIMEDQQFIYKYQQSHAMKNEVKILPADEIIVECEFNTMGRSNFTFGGDSLDEETCEAVLFYYPQVNLKFCESKPEYQSFFRAFGVSSVVGDGLRRLNTHSKTSGIFPPMFALEDKSSLEDKGSPFQSVFVNFPTTMYNVSLAKRMEGFDWTDQRLGQNLETYWKSGKYFLYCEGQRTQGKEIIGKFPKFQPNRHMPSPVCRRTAVNSTESKNSISDGYLLVVIASTLFIKVSFDVSNYLV